MQTERSYSLSRFESGIGGAVLECGNLSIVRRVDSKRDAPPVWLLVADRSVEFRVPLVYSSTYISST